MLRPNRCACLALPSPDELAKWPLERSSPQQMQGTQTLMPVPLEYSLEYCVGSCLRSCLGPCQGSKRSRPRRLASARRSQLEYSNALRTLFSLPASYQRPERMEVARSAMLKTAIAN